MSSGSFFFDKPVGILQTDAPCVSRGYTETPCATIEMTQNGFRLRYGEKEFIATTLDEALEMVKSWFEDAIKEAEKSDKK